MILRDGDIILIRARWWLHPLTRYDHAALLYSRGLARYSIEAGFSGVRDWPWPQIGSRPWVIMRPQCDASTAYDAITWAMTQRGQPYAFWHLPAIIWRIMRARSYRRIKGHIYAQEARVCSELVVDAYRAVGLDITPGVKRPTPDDIRHSEFVDYIGSII